MKKLLLVLLTFAAAQLQAQTENFRFIRFLHEQPNEVTPFAVPYTSTTLETLLKQSDIIVKKVNPEWIYIQATPTWINNAKKSGLIPSFYFEFHDPHALNDTMRLKHFVNDVHNGLGGLPQGFTGKDVIIGYVDQGLDHTHPDFKNPDGTTRVLYYWDHTLPFNAVRTPAQYGYGQVWNSSDINGGICTSTEGYPTAHGTSVTGAGSSNGSATGREKGVAPESHIIVVETNFSMQNWTLSIADACDFIFAKADELGLPAVVNLSLGTYLGSHDGNDPAAVAIENLLDAKNGRIVVVAAGNSGAWPKYHVHDDVTSDTSFTWIVPNPGSQLGANTCYMDLWSDASAATWSYALAANESTGSFSQRAETIYRTASTGIGTAIFDTLYNANGDRIATVELYPSLESGNFHMEIFFSNVDSTSYNMSFKTVGSGSYDGWTGSTNLALNNLATVIPDQTTFPPIIHYNMPDSLQSIVSSWNCSERVVSVGNVRNRYSHIDAYGNTYLPAPSYISAVNELSMNSSKGPNRHGHIKPDISASGDVSLSAGPAWLINDPASFGASMSDDSMHVRNGGTSMASPAVAGMAALYLEYCNQATYNHFLTDLHNSAFTDGFTGAVPNNAYGYGKAHALNCLLELDVPTAPTIAANGQELSTTATGSLQWYQDGVAIPGATGNTYIVPTDTPGVFYVAAVGATGCESASNTIEFTVGLEEISNQFTVFPNPFQSVIQVEMTSNTGKINQLILFGIDGKQIISSTEPFISTKDLPAGTYLLTIYSNNGIAKTPVIKH